MKTPPPWGDILWALVSLLLSILCGALSMLAGLAVLMNPVSVPSRLASAAFSILYALAARSFYRDYCGHMRLAGFTPRSPSDHEERDRGPL